MDKQTFIKSFAPFAQKAQRDSGILACIILAASALESGWAKSGLSQAPTFNFFGIKPGSSWKGATKVWRTAEQRKNGEVYYINTPFRSYPTPYESFMDYAALLQKPRYQAVVAACKKGDWEEACRQIQKCGYATDVKYADKLIATIKANNFDKYNVLPVKTLRKGDRGVEVKELQSLLNKKGARLAVDGIYGIGTYKAVKEFQTKVKISADGIAGKDTFTNLYK